jgi:hypothetical protein
VAVCFDADPVNALAGHLKYCDFPWYQDTVPPDAHGLPFGAGIRNGG